MRFFAILSYLLANPYFSQNIDYIFFNKPVCFINLKQRQSILSKWYNYDQDKKYSRPIQTNLPDTCIWCPYANKTQHIQYMAIGTITNTVFRVEYILTRPYIVYGNMVQFKKDLENYNNTLQIKYTLYNYGTTTKEKIIYQMYREMLNTFIHEVIL